MPVSPRLRFETVAGWWLERFEAKVTAGERHPRRLEAHRYQLDRHLLPALGRRAIAALTVDDVAELLHQLRRTGCSAKTAASTLATLQSVMRFARRCGWIVADPVERLEHDERPGRSAAASAAEHAELVAALCLATDLGMGFPFEHGLHTTLIAMWLADRLGVDRENVSQTYYACLLAHSGCTTDAHVTPEVFGDSLTTHSTR